MAKKILVTPRSLTRDGHPALDRLKEAGFEVVFCTRGKQPDENELLSLVPGCVGWLAGVERISARVFEAAKELKVIGRNGVGVDKIDLAAAETAGVSICKAVGANSRGVAELAFASILSLVRAIPFSDARLKAGEWERRKGVELDGRTLGLVGCGRIGKLVAGFGLAFGMKVLAHDPYPDESFAPAAGLSYVDLDRVLAGSDVVSLHCPPREDGRPLIDKTALAKMKEGAYLVNTARAELLDEEAVLEALRSGRIAGLATDVYRQEPPTGSP
ncbi:MAG: phosphoglycerate dehydrogenase, partial [Planctomycetota bacterium]